MAAFSFPGAGEIGNSGRNSFRGPTYYNVDASLVKRFRLHESQAVTFRAEAYNLFNHAQFGTPSLSLTTSSDVRQIQRYAQWRAYDANGTAASISSG